MSESGYAVGEQERHWDDRHRSHDTEREHRYQRSDGKKRNGGTCDGERRATEIRHRNMGAGNELQGGELGRKQGALTLEKAGSAEVAMNIFQRINTIVLTETDSHKHLVNRC